MPRRVWSVVALALVALSADAADAARVSMSPRGGEFELLRIRDRSDTANRFGIQFADRGRAVIVRDSTPLELGGVCQPVGESRLRARCDLADQGESDRGFSAVVVVTRAGRGDDHFTLSGRARYRQRFLFAFTDMGRGADRVRGGEGAESVIPGPGPDRVDLGFGPDQVVASPERDGRDTIEGEGVDALLYFRRESPVTVDLRGGVAGAPGEGDRISDIRVAIGGRADDELLGGGARNLLLGGPGADLLLGRGGDDDIEGAAGADDYDAGAGRDFVFSADGLGEPVDCGSGPDFAFVDDDDVLSSCEEAEAISPPILPRASRFERRAAKLPEAGLRRTLRRHLVGTSR